MEELLPRPRPPDSPSERARSLLGRARIERALDWVRWFGAARLVAVVVSIALVVAGGVWLLAPPPPPVEASLPMAGSTTTGPDQDARRGGDAAEGAGTVLGTGTSTGAAPPDAAPAATLLVHVAGAVVVPGVHVVATGGRVADAVAAAGGPTADAHTDAINLAAPVSDGDRVYVPRVGDAVDVPVGVTPGTSPPAAGGAPAGPVSINTATAEQLDALPGIGPATAAAIVAHREANGPFPDVDALADVRGIGPAKLEAIRPLVVL